MQTLRHNLRIEVGFHRGDDLFIVWLLEGFSPFDGEIGLIFKLQREEEFDGVILFIPLVEEGPVLFRSILNLQGIKKSGEEFFFLFFTKRQSVFGAVLPFELEAERSDRFDVFWIPSKVADLFDILGVHPWIKSVYRIISNVLK